MIKCNQLSNLWYFTLLGREREEGWWAMMNQIATLSKLENQDLGQSLAQDQNHDQDPGQSHDQDPGQSHDQDPGQGLDLELPMKVKLLAM